MKTVFARAALVVGLLFSLTIPVLADTPDENTIPIIGLKPDYEGIDTDFYCLLSWHHFDGLSRQGYEADSILHNVVLPADTVGMLTVVNPWILTCVTSWYAHMNPMTSQSAFARPGWDGYVIDETHTCSSDTLISIASASEMESMMEDAADELEMCFNDSSHSVWFYYGEDEAPAWQWTRMVNDSSAYDNYMPNLFTQDSEYVFRPDLDSTWKWQPSFDEVDSQGVLSWMNWQLREADSTRTLGYIISCLHTISESNPWAYYDNQTTENNNTPGNSANQAQAVRSIFSMVYEGAGESSPYDNYPSFIALDAYPFRLVGTQYQADSSYTPSLGSSLENWMINHYEECMDSTFIPAWQIRNLGLQEADIFFVPQAFGRAGGEGMWLYNDTLVKYFLDYGSYAYRIPTPQEFRMHCNSALLRSAKAILPYCLTSYVSTPEQNMADAGLLDENNIPFDAPYEEWVYRDRPTDTLSYISPDMIPPFMEDYDPLFELPDRPVNVPGSQRNKENFLLWKFSAYGRLWNSVMSTFGDIARVAPELALLDWWEDHEDLAEIDYDGTQPTPFLGAQIKVFTDENEDNCYLYYLNRYCRANENPYEITVDASDFPDSIPFSEYALDHSRRFLIEGDMISRDVYQFLDTLDAGEARLIQMFDSTDGLDADIRITDPDVFVVLPADSDTLSDYESYAGAQVNVYARFYNMGTEAPQGDVLVYLKDETDNLMLDTARVSFSGLSTGSCYQQDRDEAVFEWRPDSTDIGVHRLLVYTESLNEPDPHDNEARLVYVVEPRDYATEILSNPWDMTESSPPITSPPWKTFDIDSLTGYWGSYTDSISGMFEGTLTHPDSSNGLYLNVGSGSSDWIDADLYNTFSMYGYSSDAEVNIRVHWTDRDSNSYYVNTGESLTSPAGETGSVDLSSLSNDWTSMVSSIWLEFYGTNLPTDIRIGWIRLNE